MTTTPNPWANWLERDDLPPAPPDYHGVSCEVGYPDHEGVTVHWYGVLTTEHPASSRGLPVFVRYTDRTAYGPADLPAGAAIHMYHDRDVSLEDWTDMRERVIAAGYEVLPDVDLSW